MSPRNLERIFEKRYAKTLSAIADGDRKTVLALLGAGDIRFENAFFIAQQAIEKALKAVLVAKGLPVPMVHDLGVLIAKLPNDSIPPFGYELKDLNEYAGIRRYEEGHWLPGKDELQKVYDTVVAMLEWAQTEVQLKI